MDHPVQLTLKESKTVQEKNGHVKKILSHRQLQLHLPSQIIICSIPLAPWLKFAA